MNAQVKEQEKEHKVGYVGRRLSNKQMKLFLANTPKHGPASRQMAKFYMGMIKNPPGPATQPNSKKKEKK